MDRNIKKRVPDIQGMDVGAFRKAWENRRDLWHEADRTLLEKAKRVRLGRICRRTICLIINESLKDSKIYYRDGWRF